MAVSVVGSSNSGNAVNTTTRATVVPAGTQADDVAVCVLDRWFGSNINPAITFAGFTQVPGVVASGDNAAKTHVFYKRLTGTDGPGNYSCSWTTAGFAVLRCVVLRGVLASGDPVVDSPAAVPIKSVSGTYGAVPDLSLTADAGAGLVWAMYNDSTGTHTPPTGYTELTDVDCAALAVAIATGSGVRTATGGSVTSSSPAAGLLVGFKPQAETEGSTATIDLVLSKPTVSLTGQARTEATLTAPLSGPVVALTATARTEATLDLALSGPEISLFASPGGSASLALTLSKPVLGLMAQAEATATLEMQLPKPSILLSSATLMDGDGSPVTGAETSVIPLLVGRPQVVYSIVVGGVRPA